MNKEWVREQQEIADKRYEESLNKLKENITKTDYFDEKEKKKALRLLKDNMPTIIEIMIDFIGIDKPNKNDDKLKTWIREMKELISNVNYKPDYTMYEDSDEIEFDGDILITDPCYFVKNEDYDKVSFYMETLKAIGIPHSYSRDTIYGDWSCHVFDKDNKPIGEFCADGGCVCVALMDEVMKYNPEFNYPENRPWTSAVIKNFKGKVKFIVIEEEFEYKGKMEKDYSLEIHGKGVNKETGEEIIFKTSQTGL